MTAIVGTLALAAMSSLSFALLAALASLFVVPRVLRGAPARAAVDRARAAFWLAVGPALAGLGATALCFLPSLANLVGVAGDHCLRHEDDHLHFCFVHHPVLRGSIEPLALALLAAFVVIVVARELRARLRIAALEREIGDVPGAFIEVDSPVPFAATLGRLRPRVLISRALRTALTTEQLAVVLAHECGHVTRRDLLWRLLVDALSLVHWPSVRRALIAEHALACELACDEVAAAAVGDRLLVAETIVAVERLLPAQPHPAPAFADRDVETRVEALLAPPLPAAPARLTGLKLALAIGVTVALADPLHHATETILGLLTH